MQISVVSVVGKKKIVLNVEKTESIESVKMKIQNVFGMPANSQILQIDMCNVYLKNWCSLADFDISDNDTLKVFMSSRRTSLISVEDISSGTEMKFPSSVDSTYEVVNGFVGMNKNIFLRICEIINSKTEQVMVVVGMCAEHFMWKGCDFFSLCRRKCLKPSLNSCSDDMFSLTNKFKGVSCAFNKLKGTVFLQSVLKEGVYQWTVQIACATEGSSTIFVGGSIATDICLRPTKAIQTTTVISIDAAAVAAAAEGEQGRAMMYVVRDGSGADGVLLGDAGGCSLYLHRFSNGTYEFGLNTCHYVLSYSGGVDVLPPDANLEVSVEYDASAHTFAFSVEGAKIPLVITHLPEPFHLGASGWNRPSFTSRFLRKLPRASVCSAQCMYYKM